MTTRTCNSITVSGKVVLRSIGKVRTNVSHPPKNVPKRTHAKPVKRIFDRQNGEFVGWLYEWNTGALVPRWKNDAREHVIFI